MKISETELGWIIEGLARSQPTAPALQVPGRKTLTYADLGAQIRYVRDRLGSWDIVPGDMVAGVIPTRPEMALACATIPAVATFAPLSPALTPDSYAAVLTRLRPKLLILPGGMDHPIRAVARRCGVAEVDLTADAGAPAGVFTLDLVRQDQSLTRAASSRPDWAYVLTTSGTTGRPKLVPMSHRRLALYAPSLGDWLGLTANDVGCHLLPMHLNTGLHAALMIPLMRGGSVVCVPESDIDGFFAALDEYRITWLQAVFTVYRALLRRAPDFREAVARNRLRFMRVVSGRLESDEIDRIEQTFGAPLLIGFGMTEASMITHDPLPPRVRKRGSVGVTTGCNEVAIMSEGGTLCAAGEAGEIVVRGPLVFDGYFDDAQANAAAFVDGRFRTGDVGRFDDEGYLYLVGRIKELINRGGEKISPVAIDVAIEAIPGVRAAATFAIPHRDLGEEVVAAVIKDGNAAIDEAAIIARVRQQLGPIRAPRRIYFVDQLPRTDSGKVRRSDLPRLLGLDQPGVAAPTEPALEAPAPAHSPLEAELAGLWSTVLQVKSVGANEDFFLLGGDSLRGARLLTSVETVFGVELTIQELFGKSATVAGMVRAIENARAGGTTVGHAPHAPARTGSTIPRRQERGAAHLSDTQKRMWFLDRLDPANVAYNESCVYRLTGAIDVGALRRALHFVIGRHEILRTTFSLVDEEPRQIVHDDAAIDLQLADLAAIPAGQQSEAMERLLHGESQRAFDLEAGPTLRVLLLRLSKQEHLLLRVVHNIVLDGWSSGIFESELCIAYNAFVTGREPQLPELPIQYADYAAWQREWLQGEVLEEQLAYWKSQLADLSTLELPTDRPRPPVASDRGAHLTFELPAPLTVALKALGQREGATLFMTLLAAFQVLLHRYSGQEDIAVGAPIAGRTHRETEGLIGFFVNTLVLRTDVSGNPAFRQLLARVRENAIAAYTHQDLPFEKLVEELAPARDLSRNPLFQVMFALQNAPGATLALEGLEVSRQPLEGHTAKFDLYLAVRATPAGLRMSWEFSTDLFDASTIECMARHFGRLLEAIVADPEQRIGELPLLNAAERHQQLMEWNNTAADYPRDRCIHELFEAQSARTPEAVAVVFEERQLTYAELNACANELAQHLITLGVGPEVLVGICLERSLESIVGMLGILKAGGAYVPLDPGYPKEHLAFILRDTQAPVLLTQQGLLGQLPQYEGRILCLDRDWPQISAHNQDGDLHATSVGRAERCAVGAPAARPEPKASAAYVIYTSGSTGIPKGVVGLHQGIVNRLSWMWKNIPFDPGEVFCQKTSLTFVDSVCEIFGPLLQGFPLVVVSDACVKDPRRLVEILSTRHVTRIVVVPSLLSALLETYDDLGDRLPRLKLWVTSGEALSPKLLRRFKKQLPHSRLLNLYGSSEVSADVTCYDTAATRSHSSVPIGRPIANTRVYILDRHGEPVPVGVPGELYVAGAGLARGYLNRPELTAEKFLPDPFSGVPGAGLYRTGDLARYRPDGNIEYLGRVDDQVKIRGFRVDLGEVEAALAEHPAVRQAVVLARDDALGDKRLVAYVVLDTDRSLDQRTMRTELRHRLPDYMIPSHFITLPALPLTPHGKCDRMALEKMEGVVLAVGTEYVAPRSELECQLTAIWQEVLDQERVGIHDNFFDLGGHSLLAARLAVEIEKRLHRKLPIATLFQSPTVESLARWFTEENWAPQWSSLVPLQPLGSKPPLFLMHGWGGDVYGLLGLARLLARDQPTYGLQAVGLDGKSARHTNVEDMAAHYVREIRSFQPAGPYYLGGYSMGGVIAFEVAQQLHRVGQRVALLALLDGAPIGTLPWTIYGRVLGAHIRSRWSVHLRRWWEMPSQDRLNYLRGRWAALQFWVARNRSKPPAVTAPPPVDSQPPQVPGFADYYLALVSKYRFHRYPGSADVFVSDDAKPHWASSWRHLVRGDVAFHRVPGEHLQILLPDHVPALAKSLTTVIHRAQEKERAAPHSRSGHTYADLVS